MCCSERNWEPDGESAAHTATAPPLQPGEAGEQWGLQRARLGACPEGCCLWTNCVSCFANWTAKSLLVKWPNSVDISESLFCLLQ